MLIVDINDDMRLQAEIEAGRREEHIRHHFGVGHMSKEESNVVGFLGEFACRKLLGLDWKDGIRKDYLTIDNFDIAYKGQRLDVKTETVPQGKAMQVVNRTIADDVLYVRRLINEGQWGLLHKYDVVVFGLFVRDWYHRWYAIGYRDTKYLLANYKPQLERPDGGVYPSAGAAVRTSELMGMGVWMGGGGLVD